MRDIEIKEQPIRKCVSCDRFFVSGRWSDRLEPQLSSMFGESVRIAAVVPEDAFSGRMPKRVHLQLELFDRDPPELVEIDLPGENTQCPDCEKQRSQYFEGYLQLRGGDQRRWDTAKELLESHRGHVKQTIKAKDGVDYKVSSNKAILATLKDLSNRYVGTSSVSTTLHTRDHQSSKEKHRVTGLFRFLPFEKGDVLVHDDAPFVIEKTKERFCELRSLVDGRTTVSVSFDDLRSMSQVEAFDTSVVAIRPELTILSESYESVPAANRSGADLTDGQNVRAIGHRGFYAVLEQR